MPIFEAETLVTGPPDKVFDFLVRPANLLQVSPPELHLRLVEGPERLSLGARYTGTNRISSPTAWKVWISATGTL